MVQLEEPVAIMHEEHGGGDYFLADFSSKTIDVIKEKSSYFRLSWMIRTPGNLCPI